MLVLLRCGAPVFLSLVSFLNALEKVEFEKRIKKAGPFNSGNKSQATWGGYGAKPKGIYKAGGMVKKCRMDGIALRGKTRAKERSK